MEQNKDWIINPELVAIALKLGLIQHETKPHLFYFQEILIDLSACGTSDYAIWATISYQLATKFHRRKSVTEVRRLTTDLVNQPWIDFTVKCGDGWSHFDTWLEHNVGEFDENT
jgi:L-rhamnose mutarotase